MSEIEFLPLSEVNPEDLMVLLNEDSLRTHLIDHPYFDSTSIQAWMEDKIKTNAIQGCRIRIVLLDGELAGWCGIQPDNNGFELAIVISQKFWGYGIQIFKTLMCWAKELGHTKILLLGANGRTGRGILNLALEAGDDVTAVVRSKDKLADIDHPNLNVLAGDVCEPEALQQILPGHDVVISTLGPRSPTKAACRIYSDSAVAVVDSMQKCGISRLLVVSTALLFPSSKLLDRVLRFIARNNAHNASLMENTILASKLEWTIARVGFLNEKKSEEYRLAEGALPEGSNSIPRAALAHFLITEAKQSNHPCNIVGVSE